jgi:glycerol-3-phosphate acyltransferase PlsY
MQVGVAVILSAVIGYLCGSIPFGVILTQMFGAGDLRKIGSGNIGATNVLRTGRKGLAAATLLGDMLKGTAAVLLVNVAIGAEFGVLAGLSAFIGHLFPVWLRFKGGKGVATYLGVTLALVWPAALAFAIVWLLSAWLTRYSSLSALLASIVTPVIAFYLDGGPVGPILFFMTVALWWMHRANITRLIAGTEGRIGSKNERPAAGLHTDGTPKA